MIDSLEASKGNNNVRTAQKNKNAQWLRIFYGTFISYFFKYNLKLLTEINFFYTPKKCLLMLVYQVEVITFPKMFLRKIMLSI